MLNLFMYIYISLSLHFYCVYFNILDICNTNNNKNIYMTIEYDEQDINSTSLSNLHSYCLIERCKSEIPESR